MSDERSKKRSTRTVLIRTTVDLRLLRHRLFQPAARIDPETMATNRLRAESLISRARANVARHRSPETAAKVKRLSAKRREVHARLQKVIATRTFRSPEEVVRAFMKRIEIDKGERATAAPASLLIRSKNPDIEAQLAKILGTEKLSTTGITVSRLPVNGKLAVFSVRFPIAHRAVRNELRNLAWALRKTGAFESVTLNGLRAAFYAPEPTAATHAERNFAWHHELTRTSRAHELEPGPHGKCLGEGIVIAHPDTGWSEHPEYNEARIDTARSYNVVTGRTGGSAAKHSVRNGDFLRPNIGHGTSTASLMVGGAEDDDAELSTTRPDSALHFPTGFDGKRNHLDKDHNPRDKEGHITGIAPRATVLPIKLISDTAFEEIPTHGFEGYGVFRLFDDDFVKAVQYAIDQSAHVMSLSIGGLLHDEVRDKLDEAILCHDMIVVAAAGQTYAFNALSAVGQAVSLTNLVADDSVILPAAYANVIAVAGCAPNGAPWSESHRGPNVDITAPADAIWVADRAPHDDKLCERATRAPVLECASGTSWATAIIAGTAALWLAHWGREHLLDRYRRNRDTAVPLAWVFRHQLQRTANAAHADDWDDGLYGPGVVNVEALLKERLPDPDDVEAPPPMVANLVSATAGGLTAAGDVILEVLDFFGDQIDAGRKAAAAGVVAAQKSVEDGMNALVEGWAYAESQANAAVGAARDEWNKARGEVEQLIDAAAAAGEEFIEDTAEDAEEAWATIEEGAEDLIDNAGEAAEDLVNFLTPW